MRSAEDADVSGKKVRRFLLRDVELTELNSYGKKVQAEYQPLRRRWIDTAAGPTWRPPFAPMATVAPPFNPGVCSSPSSAIATCEPRHNITRRSVSTRGVSALSYPFDGFLR